jgi:hypothetical protein
MYCPTAGEKSIAAAPRVRAYTDMGSNVFGKIEARYRRAPNSEAREFHID